MKDPLRWAILFLLLFPFLVHGMTKEEVRNQAILYSYDYGVDWVLASHIINCESSWDLEAKNPISSASGVWQFIDKTWEETMERMGYPTSTPKTQYPISLEAGFYKLSKDGTSAWKDCLPK